RRRNASELRTGASSSVPRSDQVPELRKAVPSRAEMAATAEAVSCEAGAMTGLPESEEVRAMPGNKVPIKAPGSTIGAGSDDGSSRRAINSVAHWRFTGFTMWVVVAFVNAETAFPVSQ